MYKKNNLLKIQLFFISYNLNKDCWDNIYIFYIKIKKMNENKIQINLILMKKKIKYFK